jgi:hypothetical protein
MLGILGNGPMLLLAQVASRRVRDEAWQATAKGLVGTFLSPIAWALELALLSRRCSVRRALVLTTAGAIGGLASLAWRDRWLRFRRIAWRDRVSRRAEAAQRSRATVRELVASLVGTQLIVGMN